jgi:hypothetical protein
MQKAGGGPTVIKGSLIRDLQPFLPRMRAPSRDAARTNVCQWNADSGFHLEVNGSAAV